MRGLGLAKTPLAGPAAVLDYLSRYTQRTAIGNERLVGIEGDKVRLLVRLESRGGQRNGKRVVAMEGTQFIARLLQHVLPPGFKRIRHYGLLAPAAKTERLARARPAPAHGPGPSCAARCAMAPSTLGGVPVGAERPLFVAPFVASAPRPSHPCRHAIDEFVADTGG